MATLKGSHSNGSISALIWKVAAPTSVGYFFHTMFNITDTWFVGRISTETMAALSLSFPVFFIITAIGYGIGTGTTALVGAALGGQDAASAGDYAAQAFSFGIFIAAALTAAGLWASPWLFGILGASDGYLAVSLSYMNVIFVGSVFFLMAFLFNGVLYALGDAAPNRNFLITAFIANIILDPWFIFGGLGLPPMGIRGIGIATILFKGGCLRFLGLGDSVRECIGTAGHEKAHVCRVDRHSAAARGTRGRVSAFGGDLGIRTPGYLVGDSGGYLERCPVCVCICGWGN